MKLVVAADYPAFLECCKKLGLDPHDRPRKIRFIQTYNDFFEVENAELILYEWYEKSDFYKNRELWEFLISCGKSNKWTMPEGI